MSVANHFTDEWNTVIETHFFGDNMFGGNYKLFAIEKCRDYTLEIELFYGWEQIRIYSVFCYLHAFTSSGIATQMVDAKTFRSFIVNPIKCVRTCEDLCKYANELRLKDIHAEECVRYFMQQNKQNYVYGETAKILLATILEHNNDANNYRENGICTTIDIIFADEYIVRMIVKWQNYHEKLTK